MTTGKTIRALLASALLVLSGCTVAPTVSREEMDSWSWPQPPAPPRVKLVRVLKSTSDLSGGRSSFWEALTGGTPQPLFTRPYGVAWEGEALLVSDPGASRLVRIGPAGEFASSPPGLLQDPIGVVVCSTRILVSEARPGRVSVISRDLKTRKSLIEGLQRPTGLACLDGTVAIAHTGAHEVILLGPDDERRVLGKRGSGPGEFNFPSAVAGAASRLLVGDTLNFRVQLLDASTGASGGVLGALGDAPGDTPRIKGLAVTVSGQVWISDAVLDQVSVYRLEGTYLGSFGGRGTEPGRFSFPAGLAAHPDGRIAVVDSLGGRVQVFREMAEVAVR